MAFGPANAGLKLLVQPGHNCWAFIANVFSILNEACSFKTSPIHVFLKLLFSNFYKFLIHYIILIHHMVKTSFFLFKIAFKVIGWCRGFVPASSKFSYSMAFVPSLRSHFWKDRKENTEVYKGWVLKWNQEGLKHPGIVGFFKFYFQV